MSHTKDSSPHQMSCQEEDGCRELATEFVSGNKEKIRLWEPGLSTARLSFLLKLHKVGGGYQYMGKSWTHLSIVSAYGFTRIHCKNQLICKRWWAQNLANWVCLHQNAFLLVGWPSVQSAEISLHDSCRP